MGGGGETEVLGSTVVVEVAGTLVSGIGIKPCKNDTMLEMAAAVVELTVVLEVVVGTAVSGMGMMPCKSDMMSVIAAEVLFTLVVLIAVLKVVGALVKVEDCVIELVSLLGNLQAAEPPSCHFNQPVIFVKFNLCMSTYLSRKHRRLRRINGPRILMPGIEVASYRILVLYPQIKAGNLHSALSADARNPRFVRVVLEHGFTKSIVLAVRHQRTRDYIGVDPCVCVERL